MRAFVALVLSVSNTAAFTTWSTGGNSRLTVTLRSSASDQAISAYRKRFSKPTAELPEVFTKSPVSPDSLAGREFYQGEKKNVKPKVSNRDLPDKQLQQTFATIAKLYGGEEIALKMVTEVPTILSYSAANLPATKDGFMTAFCGKFKEDGVTPLYSNSDGSPKYTEQDVIDMCVRNPLLLGIRPTGYGGAENSKEDTMQLSYVIAATRPVGGLILSTLCVLLLLPAIKSTLGLDPLIFHLPGAKF